MCWYFISIVNGYPHRWRFRRKEDNLLTLIIHVGLRSGVAIYLYTFICYLKRLAFDYEYNTKKGKHKEDNWLGVIVCNC